jgi:uncharacterized protein (DUF1778 family)
MTVQLDWPPEVVDRLSEEARQKGLSLSPSKGMAQPIFPARQKLRGDIRSSESRRSNSFSPEPGLPQYGNLPYTSEGEDRVPQTTRRARTQKRPTPPAKTYRFDARLNEQQKLLIQRAADLEGRTMTDFVLHSAEAAAEQTIEKRAMLVLTARETEAFVDAILNPPGPGPVLRKAVREYREKMGLR